MFEKDAEEYAEINKPFLNRYDCVCVFKGLTTLQKLRVVIQTKKESIEKAEQFLGELKC